jgi:predicted nucleic acid-binding protein
MIWVLDTSILVSAQVVRHPHHVRAVQWLERSKAGKVTLAVCAHALAETFSVLSRMRAEPRMTPSQAEILIQREVVDQYQVLPVGLNESRKAIALTVAKGRSGGAVHDALHVVTAQLAGADRVWTFNLRDFIPLWDAEHVQAPPDSIDYPLGKEWL